MDVIEKALQTASKSHEGQYRKNTDIPYITHPVAVGMMLLKAGYSEEIVAAGILHDTVEDTPLTIEDIEKEFGAKIANIVEGSSEPDKSLPWIDRKEHTINFLKTASEDIRAVVSADKLHNIRSIIRDYEKVGEEVWERFNAGREQQKWYYTNVVESLGTQSTFDLLKELRNEVDKLFKVPFKESIKPESVSSVSSVTHLSSFLSSSPIILTLSARIITSSASIKTLLTSLRSSSRRLPSLLIPYPPFQACTLKYACTKICDWTITQIFKCISFLARMALKEIGSKMLK